MLNSFENEQDREHISKIIHIPNTNLTFKQF